MKTRNLADGTYSITIKKGIRNSETNDQRYVRRGYAPEILCILPHYVVVKGQVIEGKGNGVANARLEFDSQYTQLLPFRVLTIPIRDLLMTLNMKPGYRMRSQQARTEVSPAS